MYLRVPLVLCATGAWLNLEPTSSNVVIQPVTLTVLVTNEQL